MEWGGEVRSQKVTGGRGVFGGYDSNRPPDALESVDRKCRGKEREKGFAGEKD